MKMTPPKAIVDQEKVHELLTRGVDTVYPSREALEGALMSGRRLRVYNGIDPTAATLHIGHLASLQKLRQFQELGHEVIMLVGDFTGMIGDPTGKSKARVPLTRAQVRANAKTYKEQAASVIRFTGKNAAKVMRNGAWWDTMTALRFMELCSLTTAQRVLERDMFQERLKNGDPIAFHELAYPILQGYDSVAMHVDVEIGGSDQTFNMLMGRDYVRKMEEREKFIITVPLLADASGKKIGKSEGNMVELGADPENLFGQAMALPDGVIVACFEQCTAVPMAKVEDVRARLAKGENPRDCKIELAEEFVRMRYGATKAAKARAAFSAKFQERTGGEERIMHTRDLGAHITLTDFLVHPKVAACASKSEARRLIEHGGVRIGAALERATDPHRDLLAALPADGLLIEVGKKRERIRIVA